MNEHARAKQLSAQAIDFPVDRRARREQDAHLATCSACRAFAAAIVADAAQLRTIASVPAPVSVRVALTEAVSSPGQVTWRFFDPRSMQRLRLAIAFALVAALVVGLIASGLLVGAGLRLGIDDRSPGPVLPTPAGLAAPITATVARTIAVCPQAGGLQAASGALWFLCGTDVWRADASTGRVALVAHGAGAVVPGGGAVWAIGSDAVLRLRPDSGATVKRIAHTGGSFGIADNAALWIADTGAGTVTRIDATTERVVATIHVGKDPEGLALSGGSLWVANRASNSVSRIDSATNRVVATIRVGAGPLGVAVAGGAVWVANNADGTVSRIDPATNGVITVQVDPATFSSVLPAIAAASDRSVWLVDSHSNRLVEIDAATATVARQVTVPSDHSDPQVHGLDTIAVLDGSLWVVDVAGSILEIQTP